MIKKGSLLFFLSVCFFGQAQMNNLLHLNTHSKDVWLLNNKKHKVGDISEFIEEYSITPGPLKSFLPVQPFHSNTKTSKTQSNVQAPRSKKSKLLKHQTPMTNKSKCIK